MSQVALIRQQLQQSQQFLDMTLGDVTPEQLHWVPPCVANPLRATLAHLITGEDGFVNGALRGAAPLAATSWADKAGLSEPPPPPFPPKPWDQWGRQVRVDLQALRQYGAAVFAATDEYLATLGDDDLSRPIDLSAAGVGQQTLAWALCNGVLGHRLSHWGEIACLKGLQGGRGYPA